MKLQPRDLESHAPPTDLALFLSVLFFAEHSLSAHQLALSCPHLVVTGAGWHHWGAHTPPQQGPNWTLFSALLLEKVQGRLCLLPCLPPPASWGPLVVLRFESPDLVFKSALVQRELQVPELAVFVPYVIECFLLGSPWVWFLLNAVTTFNSLNPTL